jgi:ring-1,2-phenylacetyl-CoA epoxidase subunit PaaE
MESILYLKVDGKDHRVLIKNGESIVDACNRLGIEVPQSCLSGYCSTCKCKLVSGEVNMKYNLCLTENEVNKGYILSCQSKPTTDRLIIKFD